MISVCRFNAGDTRNIIPQTARLLGSVRMLKDKIATSARPASRPWPRPRPLPSARAKAEYERGYPATFNHVETTQFMQAVVSKVGGRNRFARR